MVYEVTALKIVTVVSYYTKGKAANGLKLEKSYNITSHRLMQPMNYYRHYHACIPGITFSLVDIKALRVCCVTFPLKIKQIQWMKLQILIVIG